MTLTDRATGGAVYPVTSARCVIDNNGVDADTRLTTLETAMPDKVDAVPGMGLSHEDYTAQDKAKVSSLPDKVQRALTPSDDFVLSPAANLSLTDKAKLRIFIDLWNAACGQYGRYNEETGFFELSGLTDISYEEALKIYSWPVLTVTNAGHLYLNAPIRTHLPSRTTIIKDGYATFAGSQMETINVSLAASVECFKNCTKLKRIECYAPNSPSNNSLTQFINCVALESLQVTAVYRKSFSLADSPLLSLTSFNDIVGRTSASGESFTIAVHPNVYAKLTGDTTNPAAAALTAEELAQWMEVLTGAVDKNITFATA